MESSQSSIDREDKGILVEIAVGVDRLLPDRRNPRLPNIQVSPDDALRAMILAEGDGLVNLAQHIAENGSNPATLPIKSKQPVADLRIPSMPHSHLD